MKNLLKIVAVTALLGTFLAGCSDISDNGEQAAQEFPIAVGRVAFSADKTLTNISFKGQKDGESQGM